MKSVVGAALLILIAINPFATGIISAANGGNFWEGFGAGLFNLLLSPATLLFSLTNAYAAGYYGIYSRDEQGDVLFGMTPDWDIQDYKSFDFERKISSKQAILGLNVSFFA